MDLASIIGLVLSFVLMIFGMVFENGTVDFTKATSFIHVQSILITFGGSLMAVLAQSESLGVFAKNLKSIIIPNNNK